jgi:hypothetical protein
MFDGVPGRSYQEAIDFAARPAISYPHIEEGGSSNDGVETDLALHLGRAVHPGQQPGGWSTGLLHASLGARLRGQGLLGSPTRICPILAGDLGVRHIPSLILGVAVLLLLAVSQRAPKPVVTMFHVRVILLVLLALLTMLGKILIVAELTRFTAETTAPLFIYAGLDLFLVFLMTFLPVYRKPDAPLA